jgi:hypothetical protein
MLLAYHDANTAKVNARSDEPADTKTAEVQAAEAEGDKPHTKPPRSTKAAAPKSADKASK